MVVVQSQTNTAWNIEMHKSIWSQTDAMTQCIAGWKSCINPFTGPIGPFYKKCYCKMY